MRCAVAVVMKSGKNVKSYLNFGVDDKSTLKSKRVVLAQAKLNTPLLSWPKDKETLLALIEGYLARVEIDKLNIVADKFEKAETKKEAEAELAQTFGEKIDEETSSEEDAEETLDEAKELSENTEEDKVDEKLADEDDEEESEEVIDEDSEIEEGEYIDLPSQLYEAHNCSAKVLGNIVRILNFRSKIIRKIRLMRKAQFDNERINQEIEKVAVYNIVLGKFLPILNKQDTIDKVNLKTATKMFEEVCVEGYEEIPTQSNIEKEIKKNKEDQDFDIVAALSYVGITVDKDDYGYYSVKKYNNGRGIKYFIGKAEKAFALSKNSVHRFVDEFLNKPIEKRKFITPGQVFITYINEAENSLGINSRSAVELSGLFGAMNSSKNAKQYFKDMIKKYSRNAEEWKDYQRLFEGEYYSNKESKDDQTNKIHIKQQAKRLVIGEIFEEIINFGDILSQQQIGINDYRISDISRDFGLNIDIDGIEVNRKRIEHLEDQTFRIVNSMHGILQQLRSFTQDIIDNYTVDYLRKEKIFLLQQEDQNEFITKKKEYEDLIKKLSYDKGKDSNAQAAYYQAQVDELTQKIGNKEYLDAKNILLKSKNNFRILLLNKKAQKDKVMIAIKEAGEKAEKEKRNLTIEEQLEIMKDVLSGAPELVITFEKGKATSWTKHKVGEKAEKKQEPLSEVDKVIEATAAKISDESHQKILQENLIREKVKKSQKEERVKSVNAYINAYGSIVGNATGVGAFGGFMPNIPSQPATTGPTFAPITGMPAGSYPAGAGGVIGGGIGGAAQSAAVSGGQGGVVSGGTIATPRNIASLQTSAPMFGEPSVPVTPANLSGYADMSLQNSNEYVSKASRNSSIANGSGMNISGGNGGSGYVNSQPTGAPNNVAGGMGGGMAPQGGYAQMPAQPMMQQPMYGGMPMGGGMMGGMPQMPMQPNYNREYQNFDFVSEGVEPCIIPYIVGYENKGATVYGNLLERYATMDRYKFLLTTNNNALYPYVETKQSQIQTPEQVISDLHIRYIKNAMSKSGLSTQDSNFATFDYKADIRRFLSQYVPQNLIDIVISDYNELIETIDFALLKDLIEHKFQGDLENYIPEDIKDGIVKSANMIASVAKVIMSDPTIRKTYDAYSSKMKQTYVSSVVEKIEKGEIPTVKLNSDEMYSRILDYVSFSIKGQNVLIQSEDAKDSGLGTYPRSTFFRQKENADIALRSGKVLTFEQNEIITTRNDPDLDGVGPNVINLFGTLYKFNGAYNKLLLKLKPYTLTGSVKFMENLVDALNEKIDLKVTVLEQEKKKNTKSLVKFASKEKEKEIAEDDKVFDYDDNDWFVRKGFVLDRNKVVDYYIQMAFGFKYALDKNKTKLKEDFYNNDILSLSKINETFKDLPAELVSTITAAIRDIMMSKCERLIDLIAYINNRHSTQVNKMLYIARMILESNNFDKKTKDEKLETLLALDSDFVVKSEDLVNPHPEIYSTTDEIRRYEELYLYYGLTVLFEKFGSDERFITPELTNYFEDMKKTFRSNLLAMIRERKSMNGYEQDLARYFELKIENMKGIETGVVEEETEETSDEPKKRVQIKNIDVIFKGIFDGYTKALKGQTDAYVLDQTKEIGPVLELVGTLPSINSEEKELEIALPNNHTIFCNIKGFLQQYLFRYIVDKEHELGPFAYVVSELVEHEEWSEQVKNIEIVANKLNAPELGINLIAKFSSINLSNDGNVLKIGDNISTVIETINRLKTPTDQQKALNRDVFYKEGVEGVKEVFEQYFSRLKLDNMD